MPEPGKRVSRNIKTEKRFFIGQLLRIQGDQLRHKRFARAETLANEAPVKILFPVVLFIFPSVFIILVGPILNQAMNTLAG